jgi:hypothetical protein
MEPVPRDPGVIVVTSVAELSQALATSVPGDTIEIRAEFTSPLYNLTAGFTLTSGQSPITILGTPRQGFFTRPEFVVPPGVDAFTFMGHSGSSIHDLDFSGGQDAVRLIDSDVAVVGLNIRNCSRDGVSASGVHSTGRVESCQFESPGRFGVSTYAGSTPTLRRNTVIQAGDCGFYVGSNAKLFSNNIYRAVNLGVFCDGNATAPEISCNNAFECANGNYRCDVIPDLQALNNVELDPRFCPGLYTLSEQSPLKDAGPCGQIGARSVEPGGCP